MPGPAGARPLCSCPQRPFKRALSTDNRQGPEGRVQEALGPSRHQWALEQAAQFSGIVLAVEPASTENQTVSAYNRTKYVKNKGKKVF